MTPRRPLLFPGALLVLVLGTILRGDADERRDFEAHVRTTDGSLRALVRDAADSSPAFRVLLARLVRSDLIVYLIRTREMPPEIDGQVTFMARTARHRYIAVRIAWDLPARRQAATLAHELQHAVEIADAPCVVDSVTLAREYGRIGFRKAPPAGFVAAFDSAAAILAGQRVWREFAE